MKLKISATLFIYLGLIVKSPMYLVAQSFATESKDSLVLVDNKSGLMWMKQDFSYINKSFLKNLDESFAWVSKINSESYAGFSDWYVPSIAEYRTINKSKNDRLLYRKNFMELDTACVWGNGAYSFWARNEKSKYVASYISFFDGFATSGNKEHDLAGGEWEGIPFGFSVRLVRKLKSGLKK
jgi:hypothetical protein